MKYATLKKWSGKLVIVVLVLCMVISMTACGRNAGVASEKETSSATETTAEKTTEATTESTEPPVETEATTPTTESEPPADNETTPKKVYVTMYTTRSVNYRTGPGTSYAKMGSINKGTAVQVVEGSNARTGWYEALFDDDACYIYAKYLSLTPPDTDSNSNSNSKNETSSSDTSSENSFDSTPGTYVGRADTSKGVSWDGVSPIIYTYTDGTTGTEPKEGATYESAPGVKCTYTGYIVGSNATGSVDGVFYCEHCGKACGDGSNGTCVRWLVGGDHTCSSCGETVPGNVCHTCDED